MFSSRFLVLGLLSALSHAVKITVSPTGGNASSPLLYGIMFEDINHSGDGGLYAELIQNRAFQGSSVHPWTVDPWTAVGSANLSLQRSQPLSSALPVYLQVRSDSAGVVGIKNPGWWGIDVKPQKYKGSFWASGAHNGSFTASLESALQDDVWATTTIEAKGSAGDWTKYHFVLHPASASPHINNTFSLTWSSAAGSSVNIGFVSLFPPTYKDRKNGMRPGLMKALKELNPSFLRMPGGNNLEGNDPPNFWKWNQTIGPLIERPGFSGTWGYQNTDGLGLVEYLHWCDDLEMEPLLAVWAGFYLHGVSIPEDDLGYYVQDTLDELEYIMGDVSTPFGALRASHGFPKPWVIKYVEVGNEDNLNGGLATYNSYRFAAYNDAIKAKYPDITVIASTTVLTPQPSLAGLDYHQYTRPNQFVSQFNFFDNNYSSAHPVLIGEYAAVQNNSATQVGTNWSAPKLDFPHWIGAVSEAVFTIGAERNTDKMIGAAYAPLLQNLNSYQWTPDLISFTADPKQDILSVSYEVIKLFSNTRLTTLLPETHDQPFGPAYWVAGLSDVRNEFILKGATYNATGPVTFDVGFGQASGTAKVTILTAPSPFSAFVLDGENPVITNVTFVEAVDGRFNFEVPNYAVVLLTSAF